MLLSKDGITVDVIHPADIARYKRLGYVEVPAPAVESQAEKPKPKPKVEKPKEGEG